MDDLRARGTLPSVSVIGDDNRFSYFEGDEYEKASGLFGVLSEDGRLDPLMERKLSREHAMRLYRGMVTIRIVDARMMALQRQGRIGFYGEALGQEASVVGTAAAMEPQDWLIPALREAGAGLFRGMPLSKYVAQIFGNADDVSKGRQMPCHPCDKKSNYVVMSSCVSSQVPHAVGIAMAMKISGDKGKVCVGYMGDGGTSEGDFHVALNFAGVTQAPCVLVCQNNQWAISTPGKLQTASETIAVKGIAYGIESLRVDGNDVLAVYEAMRYATEKARRGGGPSFLELLTYRVSAHSSSDDPSRYRDETVTEVWKTQRDPIERLKKLVMDLGWLDEDAQAAMDKAIEGDIRAVIAEQEAVGTPAVDTLIEDVYAEPWWRQRQQLADLKEELAAGGGSGERGHGK